MIFIKSQSNKTCLPMLRKYYHRYIVQDVHVNFIEGGSYYLYECSGKLCFLRQGCKARFK